MNLFDRVVLELRPEAEFCYRPMPKSFPQIPDNASELDPEIDALIAEISKIGSPKRYNYDGAYCVMDNYALSELMPKIVMSVLDATEDQMYLSTVEMLITFWLTIGRELYTKVARRYEAEQIEKNGDIGVYQEMLTRIRAAEEN